jgi:hypothetical protein
MRSHLIDEMVAWEQALVRAGARSARPVDVDAVTVVADVIEVAHDLPAVASGLRRGERTAREASSTCLAILPARSGTPLSAVSTLRISRDVARLLQAIDGTRTLDELEAEQPGIGRALETLAMSGLVDLGRSTHTTAERMKAGTTT